MVGEGVLRQGGGQRGAVWLAIEVGGRNEGCEQRTSKIVGWKEGVEEVGEKRRL